MRKLPTNFVFVKIYKNDDEYVVRNPSNHAADYFTGDWQDALQTAAKMDQEIFLRVSTPIPN